MPRINRKDTPRPWVVKPPAQERKAAPDKRYHTYRWRKARATFLAHHPTCNACGGWANVVDHITPVRAGGAFWDAANNWQPLCTPCHNRKSGREAHQYGWAKEEPEANNTQTKPPGVGGL